MKPSPFEYYAPRTLDEALALLSAHGTDAKPLAGGQSLIPAMNFRLAAPSVLVDLNAIDALGFITPDHRGGEPVLRIGAMTRHQHLERSDHVSLHAPLVSQTMPHVAHTAIRTRGTLGGSLAHADPAAELPAVMLALNASLTLASRAGTRTIAADDFFVGLFTTAMEPGELLVEVTVPPSPRRVSSAFKEFSRRHGDFALAGVAMHIALDDEGRCVAPRIALFSVGDRPVLATQAMHVLTGERPSPELFRAAADAAAQQDIDPPGDLHASSRYRRQLVNVLTRRALSEAFAGDQPSQETR